MGFRAVCVESRCKCSYGGGYLVVTKSDGTARVHLSEVATLVIATDQAYVSTYLMAELASRKIPVVFCDHRHMPVAESLPLHGAYNTYAQVKSQLGWSVPSKKRLWQRVAKDKIDLQAQVLKREGHDADAERLANLAKSVRSGDSDNREAVAAARYFPALFGEGFSRDDISETNAMLNYGYGIVLARVAREIVSRGYLTQVGIHHRGEMNPYNLASDLMEPFRPYVDIVVRGLFGQKLDTEVRHRLIDIMSDEVPYDDGSYHFGSVISYYVRDSLEMLEGRRAASEIKRYDMA